MTILASVVVPTCRRPDLLERCLAALIAQACDPASYEVIVADDAACDATRCQVEQWAMRAGPAVCYLPVFDSRGPAAARNAGWRVARGEIIAFTDDDCVPEPGWIAAGLRAMRPGVAGAAGRIVVPVPKEPTDYELDASRLETAEFATANCFYRRAALAAIGGFDERFRAAWREDSDLYFTLTERGETLAHAPEAVVVHPVRPAGWGVSLRQQRKSEYNALLYKKHPALYRQRVQSRPPLRYYAAVGALGTALGCALGGRRRVAAGSAGAWAALTGGIAATRLRGTTKSPAHITEMLATSAAIPPLAVFWRLRGAARFRVLFF